MIFLLAPIVGLYLLSFWISAECSDSPDDQRVRGGCMAARWVLVLLAGVVIGAAANAHFTVAWVQ